MKPSFFPLVPALALAFLSSPALARAEEPAPGKLPVETQALLSGLLKAASGAPAADSQKQELQASLTTLLKTLSQLVPESTTSGRPALTAASSMFDLSELLGGTDTGPSPASGRNLSIESSGSLRTGGLVTGSLGSRLADEQWRQLFQRRGTGR